MFIKEFYRTVASGVLEAKKSHNAIFVAAGWVPEED
jgi:hypothetical protein